MNISIQSEDESSDESSVDASEMEIFDTTENTPELPTPKNVNPLPQDRWHKADDIFKLIKQKTFVHNEVPPGDKSNSYMLVDNTRNAERFEANKICEFYDDCGVWIIEKGNTCKSHLLFGK